MTVETNEATPSRGRPKKDDYDVSAALDADGNAVALDDKGRLTAVPESWCTEDGMLKRENFASRKAFWGWKAHRLDLLAAEKSAEALDWREKIEGIGKPTDPKARAKSTLRKAIKIAGVDPATMTAEQALAILRDSLNA